jgi:hypothetical protein
MHFETGLSTIGSTVSLSDLNYLVLRGLAPEFWTKVAKGNTYMALRGSTLPAHCKHNHHQRSAVRGVHKDGRAITYKENGNENAF